MCTTYLVTCIIEEFSEYDIIGYPRLVRLNPNVPWKTRGNGAIALCFGEGKGRKKPVAGIGDKRYYGFERFDDIEIKKEHLKRVEKIVESNAHFHDTNTNPGIVMLNKKPPQKFYWNAVREIVELKSIKRLLNNMGAKYTGYKNSRGLIGATAAIAWKPGDKTHEIITYREKSKWGTPREVGEMSVIRMDKKFPSTFNNYDYENKKVIIAPHSPCPVLFGIRGDNPNDLLKSYTMIKTEKINRWVLFETNQATDDHLQKKRVADVKPYESVIIGGVVTNNPVNISGGHVIFSIDGGDVAIDCAAYEPTKNFRNTIRELTCGDEVVVYGGVREKPLTINIEKMKVKKLARVSEKIGNPRCPICRKSMKSMGKNVGYRCRACRTKINYQGAVFKEKKRKLKEGLYEVPVCARRHLSKPLKRLTCT
ncbi:MAG: tRNA(Ile)(2)-agmatinylcytidine synthase [Thermoplasmata archaeon]